MIAVTLDAVQLTSAIGSPLLVLIGVIYAANRSGRASERASESLHQTEAVKVAHEVLIDTIHELQTELKRQDADLQDFRDQLELCVKERARLRMQLRNKP